MTSGATAESGVVHAASVDVEDYRCILRARYQGDAGTVCETFDRDMEAVCDIFAETGTQATFFVLGELASQRSQLLRQWSTMGHELAIHGWDHQPIWQMTPDQFRQNILRAKSTVEDVIGQPVAGYRAPIFSIRWDTLWAMDVVAESGLTYDSSIMPVKLRRYGLAGFPRAPQMYLLPGGRSLVEIPMSVTTLAGITVPIGGGGYFRLFSWRRVQTAVEAANRGQTPPFVMYIHPDELGNQPFRAVDLAQTRWDRLKAAQLAWKSNLGRKKVPVFARQLLATFRFAPLGELAQSVHASGWAVPWPFSYA